LSSDTSNTPPVSGPTVLLTVHILGRTRGVRDLRLIKIGDCREEAGIGRPRHRVVPLSPLQTVPLSVDAAVSNEGR